MRVLLRLLRPTMDDGDTRAIPRPTGGAQGCAAPKDASSIAPCQGKLEEVRPRSSGAEQLTDRKVSDVGCVQQRPRRESPEAAQPPDQPHDHLDVVRHSQEREEQLKHGVRDAAGGGVGIAGQRARMNRKVG